MDEETTMYAKYERTLGYRRVYGTDFPIRLLVEKQNRKFMVVKVCNGIAENHWLFPTLRQAAIFVRHYEL